LQIAARRDGQWHFYHGELDQAAAALRAEAEAQGQAALWEELGEVEQTRGDKAAAREARQRAGEIWQQDLAADHHRVQACFDKARFDKLSTGVL
jgi:hypothetical protein